MNAARNRWALRLAVVITMAVTAAVLCAVFAVTDGLLFRPLPFTNPDALAVVEYAHAQGTLPPIAYEPARAQDRENLRLTIEHSGLVEATTSVKPNTSFGTRAKDLGFTITDVDARFFPILGVRATIGRFFTLEDELSDAQMSGSRPLPTPVVIGHDVWQRAYGGSRDVLGTKEFAGRQVRIIGVAPAGLRFPGETNVWVLVQSTKTRPPSYVRLAAGATIAQLAAIVPSLTVTPVEDAVRPERRFSILILFCAACGLGLVAWVQIATFVMATALAGSKDLGIRQALGAGRARVLLPLVVEHASVVAAAAILAGIAVRPLTAYLVSTLPVDVVRGQSLDPDLRTLAFGAIASLLGFALLALFPFALVRRSSPLQLLQGQIGGVRLRAEQLRRWLLLLQVSATVVLLYICGLMVHSLARAATYDYGFDSRRVLVFTPPFPGAAPGSARSPASQISDAEFETLSREKSRRNVASLDAMTRTPGVVASAGFWVVPLVEPGRFGLWEELRAVDGRSIPPVRVQTNAVTPPFLKALGATLISGSGFDNPDNAGAVDSAIVNETFVRQFFPPSSGSGFDVQISPIGRVIQTETSRGRIVGVMRDLVYSKATEPRTPQVFFPTNNGGATRYLVIRTERSAEQAMPYVRGSLEAIWGPLGADRFALLRDSWRAGLKPFVGQAAILTLFAASSVLVATVGLVGFLVHSVRSRAREFAVRASLGATPASLSRKVVTSALALAGAGLLAGGAIGIATGRLIQSQLFMVEPVDLATIAGVGILLLCAIWLAVLIPAREAARSNPAVLLREP